MPESHPPVAGNKEFRWYGKCGSITLGGMLNEELLNLYLSPNIIGVIKLKRMRWAGHVECM
jgi:hypothetical protein